MSGEDLRPGWLARIIAKLHGEAARERFRAAIFDLLPPIDRLAYLADKPVPLVSRSHDEDDDDEPAALL